MTPKEQAEAEIREIIRASRSTDDALKEAESALRNIEDELDMRREPYGRGFIRGKKTRYAPKLRYYVGMPTAKLEVKWHVYKDFVQGLERELVIRAPQQLVIDYDRGHTLSELQGICRQKGLPVSGDKKTLIKRILT